MWGATGAFGMNWEKQLNLPRDSVSLLGLQHMKSEVDLISIKGKLALLGNISHWETEHILCTFQHHHPMLGCSFELACLYIGELPMTDVYKSFKRMNIHKATGPDDIRGHVLKVCADLLMGVSTDICNLSLLQPAVPTCLKKRLLCCCTYISQHKGLWVVSQIIHHCFSATRPVPVCIQTNAIALTLHPSHSPTWTRWIHVRMPLTDYSWATKHRVL